MPSIFNARDAANYEKLMGRWSRRLAPVFIEHAGVADGERILEVGCGTGSLTFALPKAANIASLTAIDHSASHSVLIRLERRNESDCIRALRSSFATAAGRSNSPPIPLIDGLAEL
jgi:trans-aconitate methyltransferase